MVWVFQDGHCGSLFRDLTTTGYLVPTMPALMFCLAFGLSMDYEVFLLSRIREAWLESDRTQPTTPRPWRSAWAVPAASSPPRRC